MKVSQMKHSKSILMLGFAQKEENPQEDTESHNSTLWLRVTVLHLTRISVLNAVKFLLLLLLF